MYSRLRVATLYRRLSVTVVALLTLTAPLWIERIAASDALVRPVADVFEREEPARVAPAAIDEGIRRRLEALPAVSIDPSRRVAPKEAPAAEPYAPVQSLPRSLDPDANGTR